MRRANDHVVSGGRSRQADIFSDWSCAVGARLLGVTIKIPSRLFPRGGSDNHRIAACEQSCTCKVLTGLKAIEVLSGAASGVLPRRLSTWPTAEVSFAHTRGLCRRISEPREITGSAESTTGRERSGRRTVRTVLSSRRRDLGAVTVC